MDGFRHEMLTVEFLTEGCLESCDVAKEPTWMVATFLKAALKNIICGAGSCEADTDADRNRNEAEIALNDAERRDQQRQRRP